MNKERKIKMINFRNSFIKFVNSISDKYLKLISIFGFSITLTMGAITYLIISAYFNILLPETLLPKMLTFFVPILYILTGLALVWLSLIYLIKVFQTLIERGKIKVENSL